MKSKNKNTFLILLILLVLSTIGALIYYSVSLVWSPKKTDYQSVIDSLNNENRVLDSLYEIEKNKKEQTRIKYKKVSIKSELDSLGKLKEDLNNLKIQKDILKDSLNADSLRLILMKEFNN